jgi:manganese transport protein
VPAIFLIGISGGKNTVGLLVFSQVVLSMQLSFAIFPLMAFTSDRKLMGEFANSRIVQVIGYSLCTLIASLNIYLLYQTLGAAWMAVIVAFVLAFTIWVRFFYRGD